MGLRGFVVGVMVAWAGATPAQELVIEAFVETDAPVGARVEVQGTPAIEWSRRVELRARNFTGEEFSEIERAAIRSQGVACGRGEPRNVISGVEAFGGTSDTETLGGTFVVRYECAWLQAS